MTSMGYQDYQKRGLHLSLPIVYYEDQMNRKTVKTIFVEHQVTDKSYAVYVGGDGDTAGNHDRLFSYEFPYVNGEPTDDNARHAALTYARKLAKQIGGKVYPGVV